MKFLIKMIESYCEVICVRRNINLRGSVLGFVDRIIISGLKYILY